jgi:tight adherence protein B
VDTLVLLTSAAVAASVVLISLGLRLVATEERGRISLRVQRSGRAATRPAARADVTWQAQRAGFFTSLEEPLHRFTWLQDVRDDLRRAGLDLHASEYFLFRFAAAVTAGAVVVLIFGVSLLLGAVAVLTGVLVWIIPAVLVRRRIQKRQSLLESQLDSALTSLASAIRAGFSFLQACQMTTTQMKAPLRQEMEEALEETTIGVTIEEALVGMARRIRSYEVDIVVNAVMVHRSVGGNLAEILDSIARTLRQRRELRGHLMALTAQQRLSALFVSGVPVFMAVFLSLTSWDFMKPLWTTNTGGLLLLGGLVLDVLGFLVMRRLTRIDF